MEASEILPNSLTTDPRHDMRMSQQVNRKVLTLISFLLLTPLTFLLTIVTLLNLKTHSLISPSAEGLVLGAAAPQTITSPGDIPKSISGEPLVADARPVIIQQYLFRWHSPLAPYASLIVTTSDQFRVNPFLVVAIAQQETNLGRKGHPNCFNAWGWAQTSTFTRCFSSWDEGIKTFIKEFADGYIKNGLVTPQEIMTRYNATSPNGSWAQGVTQFLNELGGKSST